MGIICNLSCFRSFLRFYFTAERLQTVLAACDYRSKRSVATVAVFPAKAWLRFLQAWRQSTAGKFQPCNCVWFQSSLSLEKKAPGRHPLSELPLISTPHISPRWDQSADNTLKGVLPGLMLTLSRLWFHTIWSAIYCSVTKVRSLQADAAVPTPNK